MERMAWSRRNRGQSVSSAQRPNARWRYRTAGNSQKEEEVRGHREIHAKNRVSIMRKIT
jgi:hypothetical protein